MDRVANNRLRALDQQLSRTYNSASRQAAQRHRAALERLTREAATATPERLTYLHWSAERAGGLVDNIAREITQVSDTANRMINNESLSLFSSAYRDTVAGINSQIQDAGISGNMQMLDRNALNAIFNGENTVLGQQPGFQGTFEQVGFRQVFEPGSWEQLQALRGQSYIWQDRLRGRFYYERAIGRLGDNRVIVQRLREQLAQALILGESIPQITNRIQAVANMTLNQARRIARTETIRADRKSVV